MIRVSRRLASLTALSVSLGSVHAAAAAPRGVDTAFVSGNADFAFDLYHRFAMKRGNLFFSPWSIRSALGMVYAGARGATERQMAMALHDTLGQPAFHGAAAHLEWRFRARQSVAPDSGLVVANAVWVERRLNLEPSFTDTLTDRYGAPPRAIDFANPERARAAINDWVEERTRRRVRDLIPPGALAPQAGLVLCNAVYFRATWGRIFRDAATKTGAFHREDHREVSAAFMHMEHAFRYAETKELQVVELPFLEDWFAMLVLLPRRADGLDALERLVNSDSLRAWDSRMELAMVRLALPKFRVEDAKALAPVLGPMGMREAFTPRADFSGIARKRPLFLSQVYHKAFVAVDERGTEAAAATAGLITRGGVVVPPLNVDFTADHPFLFLIRHRASGAILFMGRLADPS